jgi:type IV secretory pathway VirB10-like protein
MIEKLKKSLQLLYKKDGAKITLYLPYLYWGGATFFGVFVLFQLSLPENERFSSPEPIATPQLISESVSFPVNVQNENSLNKDREIKTGGRKNGPKYLGPQLILRPRNLSQIQPGSMMQAILVSGASNGLVKAKATENLVINGETLIDAGTILIGQGSSGEERLSINFSQAIFSDGTMGQINAVAADQSDKIVGLKGSGIGAKTISIAGSVGLGFVGGLSEGLQESQGQQGVLVKNPTWKNALLNATSATAFEQSRNLMQSLKDNHPAIEIAPDTSFMVIFGGAH